MDQHHNKVKLQMRPMGMVRRGAASMEYMLILTLVVLPIGLMWPLMFKMVTQYGNRMLVYIGLPFP